MRILVVNPNTSAEMTETMRASAVSAAGAGTEIVAVEPTWGPESIESTYEGYLSAVAVFDRIQTLDERFDAVVMAGFGEPGRDGAQEFLDVPVYDITECAAHVACLLGRRYSVITTVDKAIDQIDDRLGAAGLTQRCASVRATGLEVLALERDRDEAFRVIVAEAHDAVSVDRAEVIVLGCGGMAGLDELVQEAVGVPVVDGLAAAVKLAESVHALGLPVSKVRSHAPPPPKYIAHWPVSAHRK